MSDLWGQLFADEIAGLPTRKFITANALARPRDVIYLLKQAIAHAINCGHTSVTQDDFLDGRDKYSEFVFRSILAEDDPNRGHLEAVLYEFAGAPKIVTEGDVRARMSRASVTGPDSDFYLNLLCDVNFLGIFTVDGYRFPADEGERQVLLEMAKRITADRGLDQTSFQINAAFHQVLQIEKDAPAPRDTPG